MEGGEGMVAVVRGLRDSNLAVTLLDGSRQYTLIPNAGKSSPPPQVHIAPHTNESLPHHMHVPEVHHQMNMIPVGTVCPQQPRSPSTETSREQPPRCDSGSQATDGRYASMYKTVHCSVTPTSPPVQLTEFPPQRAELCRGHGNFEVGGSGSGEHYVPCRSNGSFRGGMSWPDRGSVCSPRPSREPDAFANSLRKYPNISVERSTEMVERLITYTQAKNIAKTYQNRYPSPSRHGIESNGSNQLVLDRSMSRNTVSRSSNYQRNYDPEVKIKTRIEESPTRDMRTNECACAEYRRMMKTSDDRCLNVTKRPYNQQSPGPVIRDRYDHNSSISGQRTPSLLTATNSVNMEVQAAAEMVSREVATIPRTEPVKKTVAVPLSRTSSSDDQKREGDVSNQPMRPIHKSVETSSVPVDLAIQTTSSNNHLSNTMHQCRCFVVERNNKSEERIKLDKELTDEILVLLNKVSICPNADSKACDLRKEILQQMSEKLYEMSKNVEINETTEKNEIENMVKHVPIWIPCGDVQSYREAISDEIISKMSHYKAFSKVFRAETQIKMRTESNDIDDLLHNVISGMPIKTMDIFGKPVEKNRIVETYVKRLKRLITNISDKTDLNILKSEILVLMSKIPIAISTYNKIAYLNKLVDSLMIKLKHVFSNKLGKDNLENKNNTTGHENIKMIDSSLKKYVQPTEEELKEYLSDELKTFLEKYDLQVESINDIETELIDILIDCVQDIRLRKDDNVENEIMLLLLQTVDKLPENEAKTFTEKILDKVKQLFDSDSTKASVPIPTQSYDILQNSSKNIQEKHGNLHKSADHSVETDFKEDIDANLDSYISQLIQEIEEWLDTLNIKIPRTYDSEFKQVMINDLASDIVDRLKYLKINPSSRGTDEDELEHLKYQIFKWINKLTGEGNMQTIENSSKLMHRIRSIPLPIISMPRDKINCEAGSSKSFSTNTASFLTVKTGKRTSQIMLSRNKSNIRLNMNQSLANRTNNAPTCCETQAKPTSPSMKQLNDEYDEFLKKWIEEIPLPSSTSKEKAAAEKARVNIYNGIWKAVTKLKFEPATFHNPFYYEDALDDELEELFNSLPKTSELETKKHLLKVQLIEKTTTTNDMIKSTSAPASFKQQLISSVIQSLPQRTTTDTDDLESFNKAKKDPQIAKLVGNFILCTKYKEENKSKANIYRKKLIKEVQTLVDSLKETHSKDFRNIDTDMYINNILTSLQKVPLPESETVQDEADEILLGHEVEQWFTDLPLVRKNDVGEELQRKRQTDALVKKVHEIEKEVNILDCVGEKVLQREISMFLEKAPLEDGEKNNISFMVEEFSNRMKNRASQLQNNSARKSVAFMDSVGYFEFSRQMPQCSSFSKMPEALPASPDQSSYLIRGGSIVKDSSSLEAEFYGRPQMNAYQNEESFKELPSDQYFTMEDSLAPKPKSPAKLPTQPRNDWKCMQHEIPPKIETQPENVEWHSIPMATASNIQGISDRQQSPCCQNATSPQRQAVPSFDSAANQAPRLSGATEQYNQKFSAPFIPSIPTEAQNPCCRNQQEHQQSSCCHSKTIPQRQSMISSNNPLMQEPRFSGVPYQNNRQFSAPINNIPTEAQNMCCRNHQENENGSRMFSPNRQISGVAMQPMLDPEAIQVNQIPIPADVAGSYTHKERSVNYSNREMLGNLSRNCAINEQGLPSTVSYGEPQGFSTPQQVIKQGSPPRPGRKRIRNMQKNRRDFARRRLELEDDTEDDLESGNEGCPCERMFRYRGRPICYAYDDFDIDDPQCYPIPYGSSSLVTNNFTVQLCGNIQSFNKGYAEESKKDMKSVQTSFSSVDTSTKKCSYCRRKIRSQEDIRHGNRDILLENEIVEWLNETCITKPTAKLWGEKMQRLAQKLKKPGGEEKIRHKIEKYLKRVPSQFSECDEDRREFREQLPNNIIKKLKKMYLKPDKKHHQNTSPVRILRIEVPKNDFRKHDDDRLKSYIDNWLKDIPMKNSDFLGKTITKEDVLESVVNKIEPYILNRHNFDRDYSNTLKLILIDVLSQMPVEMEDSDKTLYFDQLATDLVNYIKRMGTIDECIVLQNEQTCPSKDIKKFRDIKTFVANEIATIISKLHLSISTKRLALLEIEMTDTLLHMTRISDDNIDSAIKENIFIILHNLGGLTNYQAKYFTEIIIKHFADHIEKYYQKPEYSYQSSSLPGISNYETYSIYHNMSKTNPSVANSKALKLNNYDCMTNNYKIHKQLLVNQIEEWLSDLNIQIKFKRGTKEKAINALAEDVIDRLKYLEVNPKGTPETELQYLKYQIFKWINKMASENTNETIAHAEDLMNRINTVNRTKSRNLKESRIHLSNIKTDGLTCDDHIILASLKDAIVNWFTELPNVQGIKDTDKLSEDLGSTLVKCVKRSKDINAAIDKEVDKFYSKFTNSKNNSVAEKLKEKLKNVLSTKHKTVDSKQVMILTRKYEDIIDEWMDTSFTDIFDETADYKNRNEYIHELAIRSFETLNSSQPSESRLLLEIVALEWLKDLPTCLYTNKDQVSRQCMTRLVESLIKVTAQMEKGPKKLKINETTICTARKLTLDIQQENHKNEESKMEDKLKTSKLAVYGFTLPAPSKSYSDNKTTEKSKTDHNGNNIETHQQLYLRQLVEQIDEWLSTLQIPQIHDKGFREIVVNDLAGDIVDRQKYLALNPLSRGSEDSELEQLKYQIFKWINKLVGENRQETVAHASELMERIRSIPVPILIEGDLSNLSSSSVNANHNNSATNNIKYSPNANNSATNRNLMGVMSTIKPKTPASPSNVRLSSPLGFTTGPMAGNQMHAVNPTKSGNIKTPSNNPVCTSELCQYPEESGDLPLGLTLEQVYQHFDHIFKERVQEIPLETPNPEQEMLADLARKGMYNGIWKTFFQLKADPDIENDYSYFEMLFEEHADNILDCLPQTEEIQKIRQGWKSKLLFNVMTMLKYVHSITDTPSFRQKLVEKFDRQFIRAQYKESSDLHQHDFVFRTANAFILYSKYKEEDPIKANIYRQRLMKRIEELADTVKEQYNVEFRYINQAQLCQVAMQILESVPLPQDDTLKDEVNEIQVGNEIEEWYSALPVIPLRNETDEILRKRMRELLAKKLCELEKGINIDDSLMETDMKHEVSKFLHEEAMLQPNEDLNIDFMIEELTNRLKTRKQRDMPDYEAFEKEMPLSSTFVQTDPGEAFAPLVDIGANLDHGNEGQDSVGQVAGPSNQGYQNVSSYTRRSILGTNQNVGPNQVLETRPGNQINESRRLSGGRTDMNAVRSNESSQLSRQAAPGVVDRSFVPNGPMVCSHPPCRGGQSFNQGTENGIHIRVANAQRPSQLGESGQVLGQAHLSNGQNQGPSTAFVSGDPSPTGATRSTARVASPIDPGEVIEDDFNEGEVRYKCRCMERVWKCKRRHYCNDMDRPPRCYPMPMPCRYFY